jgi:hypothetical protein
LADLEEAFTGRFNDHHAFLLSKMLARVDHVDTDLTDLDARIEAELAPFAQAAARLDEIPGVGHDTACVIVSEIGIDMSWFPTAAHLCSWARFAPGVKESAGRPKGNGTTGHGNRYLARVLGEAAVSAGRTNTFLGERYRRIARRRGKKKAIVAVGRSILVIIWHLLSDDQARFHDLGADFYNTHAGTRTRQTQPHSPAPSTRIPSHPRTSRLTRTGPGRPQPPDHLTSIFGLERNAAASKRDPRGASAASGAIDIARGAKARIEACTPTSWRISFAGARR